MLYLGKILYSFLYIIIQFFLITQYKNTWRREGRILWHGCAIFKTCYTKGRPWESCAYVCTDTLAVWNRKCKNRIKLYLPQEAELHMTNYIWPAQGRWAISTIPAPLGVQARCKPRWVKGLGCPLGLQGRASWATGMTAQEEPFLFVPKLWCGGVVGKNRVSEKLRSGADMYL